ncbi:MAG: hypothetical protein AAFX85_14745, partial [Pseudomonadota bacterium]
TVQHVADGGVLDPNLVDAAELEQLPHVDSALAGAILAARPILSPSALDAVIAPALNAEQRGELYARLFRPIDLNAASDAEISMIPGMSPRMVHEFEEYRPYTSMAQFRREIGKYVDAQEVERLAQYVYVPVPLNAATREQLLSIPGMSGRMAHEFEEYRPYTSLDQFRREIGKYVDQDEVARLESFIVLDTVAD